MREIKFRAWDKRCNVMREVAVLHFNRITKAVSGIEYWAEQSILKSIRVKDFSLMQYTGLEDANGVEIFEGDILEIICCFESRKETVIGVVDFGETSFIFGCDDWALCELVNNQDEGKQYFKVIGNIYENKELLEVGK